MRPSGHGDEGELASQGRIDKRSRYDVGDGSAELLHVRDHGPPPHRLNPVFPRPPGAAIVCAANDETAASVEWTNGAGAAIAFAYRIVRHSGISAPFRTSYARAETCRASS